jgi:hypothetical protein
MQLFCIPTEGDNDADATTHEVQPRGATFQPPRPQPTNGTRPATRGGLIQRIGDLEKQLTAIGGAYPHKPFDQYTDDQLIQLGKDIKAKLDETYADIEATEAK